MHTSPAQLPALRVVQEFRVEFKKRMGKEGGHLNKEMLAKLDVIEATLRQMEQVGGMLNLLNQQSEVAVHGFRALSKITSALPEANGDDGTSETKGE